MSETPDPSRWQALLSAAEPVFLLDRRRRILLVNPAWEALTGLSAAQARGLMCRRSRDPGSDPRKKTTAALAPPPEVLDGKSAQVRRHVADGAAAIRTWEIEFIPLMGGDGLLAILGRISAATGQPEAAAPALPESLHALRGRVGQRYRLDSVPATLPALRRALDQARLAAQSRVPVFLVGEPGTGKEWLARAIHHHGSTSDLSCAAIDCARLPADALGELLFGSSALLRHSAFGTIYLKEVASLPRDLQARLLDYLKEPAQLRPRLIAGSSTPPADAVRAGRLLEDLRFALGTLEIFLPPLRERLADLPALAELLLERAAAGCERPSGVLAPEAWDALSDHRWPGNLAELYAVLLGACQHAKADRIELADLPAYLRQAVKLEETPGRVPPRQLPLKLLREQMERRLITLALKMARGNKSEAARILAIERLSLLARMKALGIES